MVVRTRRMLLFTCVMFFLSSFVFAFLAYREYCKPSFGVKNEEGNVGFISGKRMQKQLEPIKDNPGVREFYDLAVADEKSSQRNSGLLLITSIICVIVGCYLLTKTRHRKNSEQSPISPLKTD